MMRRITLPPRSLAAGTIPLALVLAAPAAQARYVMTADGPGATYELLQKAFTTELPDCGHPVPHITEEFDDELKKNVFVFHLHVAQDDDRCGAKDRQRTEIRGGKLPEIVAANGETVYYRWKFRLPPGFQTAPSFTHIFQIKSDQAAPIMTLTPRSGNLSIDGRIGARGTTELAKFIGVWVVVDLKVLFSNTGNVNMTIRRLSDGQMLFSHSGAADTWDDNSSGHDPKFGIYRSLNNRDMLRDEQVRFADFCVSKQSASDCDDGAVPPAPDGGAGPVDAAGPADPGAAPDGGGTPTPPATDASVAPPPGEPNPGTGQPPPSGQPTPSPVPRPRRPDSGCSCNLGAPGGGAIAWAGLVACALGLLRRRRRR
jgi:polysaccharide lyase-like protein